MIEKYSTEGERQSRQQDKERVNAEMLDPNLYTGGLRNKEARDAEVSLSVKKNHLEK